MPFFSFTFPEWFKRSHATEYARFQANLPRLTTPFDIHATLDHLLALQNPTYNRSRDARSSANGNAPSHHQKKLEPTKRSRSISLFQSIPVDRSCADAYIEPHWCSCLNWRPINTSAESVVRAARAVVGTINNITKANSAQCARLQVLSIKWATKLVAHDYLLRFKSAKDVDGFLADFSSNKPAATIEMYQVNIVVLPGRSVFEASVSHDLRENVFRVKTTEISRVNKYGDQAKCIMDSFPELRKYCYCSDSSLRN